MGLSQTKVVDFQPGVEVLFGPEVHFVLASLPSQRPTHLRSELTEPCHQLAGELTRDPGTQLSERLLDQLEGRPSRPSRSLRGSFLPAQGR